MRARFATLYNYICCCKVTILLRFSGNAYMYLYRHLVMYTPHTSRPI